MTSYVAGNFSYTAEETKTIHTYPHACKYLGRIINYMGGEMPVKNYSCTVNMSYFDEPDVDWVIDVHMKTTEDIWSDANRTQTFQTERLLAIAAYPLIVNWTGVVIGSRLNEADNLVTFENLGNVDILDVTTGKAYLSIEATTLQGESQPAYTIDGGNFTADEPAGIPCGQANFTAAAWSLIDIDVDHDPDDTDLMFCLQQVPLGNPAQAYGTVSSWQVSIDAGSG